MALAVSLRIRLAVTRFGPTSLETGLRCTLAIKTIELCHQRAILHIDGAYLECGQDS